MCVHVCVCICVYVCVCMYVHLCVHVSASVCMCGCTFTSLLMCRMLWRLVVLALICAICAKNGEKSRKIREENVKPRTTREEKVKPREASTTRKTLKVASVKGRVPEAKKAREAQKTPAASKSLKAVTVEKSRVAALAVAEQKVLAAREPVEAKAREVDKTRVATVKAREAKAVEERRVTERETEKARVAALKTRETEIARVAAHKARVAVAETRKVLKARESKAERERAVAKNAREHEKKAVAADKAREILKARAVKEKAAEADMPGEIDDTDDRETIGPFNIKEPLGSGCTAIVHRVEDKSGDWFALKQFTKTRKSNLEIETMQKFSGLVGFPKMYQTVENGFVMELIGPSFSQLIRERGAFSIAAVGSIGVQLVDRMEAMHSRGVVHGDLFRNNIAIGAGSKRNILYVFDFGQVVARRSLKFDVLSVALTLADFGNYSHLVGHNIHAFSDTPLSPSVNADNIWPPLSAFIHYAKNLEGTPNYKRMRALMLELVELGGYEYSGRLLL